MSAATSNRGRDVVAGLMVAMLAMPASIGVGIIAFAPLGPEMAETGGLAGLYACLFLAVVPVLFRVNPLQYNAPGPVAAGILATLFSALMADPDLLAAFAEDKAALLTCVITLGFLCSALSGGIQVLMGILKLGQFIKLIPHPIIAGLVNGIAMLVVIHQIPPILGLDKAAAASPGLGWITGANGWLAGIGLFTIGAILTTKRWFPRLPPVMVGLLLGSGLFHLLQHLLGVKLGPVIGHIPLGLPMPVQVPPMAEIITGPQFIQFLPKIIGTAITLAVLSSLNSLLTATIAESLSNNPHDSRRELLGIGAANIVSPLFAGLPGGGSPSRVINNHESGGTTYISQITCGVVILAVAAGMGPAVGMIPLTVVAAILLVFANGYIDGWSKQMVKRLVSREGGGPQFAIVTNLILSAVVTVFVVTKGPLIAIGAGVVGAFFLFLHSAGNRVVNREVRGAHSNTVRSGQVLEAISALRESIATLELQGPIFFGTIERVAQSIDTLVETSDTIILDFRRVSEVDTSGVMVLKRIDQRLKQQSKKLLFSGLPDSGPIRPFIEETGLTYMAEEGRIFADSNSALTSAEDALIQSLDLGLRTDGEVELKDLPLLGGFEPEELEELERIAEKRSYPAKTYIIKEGEKSDGFFLLTSGRASVLAGTDSDDRQVSLVIFDVGTMFGELSLLLEDPIRTASVYAVTDASCYFISVDALDQLQANEPSLYAKLVTNMGTNLARRLIDASETIRDHGL